MDNISQSDLLEYHLQEKHYEKAAEFYESLVEEQPETPEYYWYLGLAYLLQGKEEEAQLTWFVALNQQETEEEIEIKTQELTSVLEAEAQRQEKQQNYQLAWLIRGHIRELQPDNLPNLLNLICLDVTLGYPTTTKLGGWGVIELLSDKNTPRLPTELVIKALEKILYIISDESLDFARACLKHSTDSLIIVETVSNGAKKLNLVKNLISYPASLINVCLEKQGDDLGLLKTLFVFYSGDVQYYQKALEVATVFLKISNTITARIFGLRQLLSLYLRNYNWSEGMTIAKQYIKEITLSLIPMSCQKMPRTITRKKSGDYPILI
jgi:tetratricopeptide (TPR) repeat protein